MEIKISGELEMAEIVQALYELLHELEISYGVKHALGLRLYLHCSDGYGERVVPRKRSGEEVTRIRFKGPYRSAASEFKIN